MRKTFYCVLVIVFVTGCKKDPNSSNKGGNNFTVATLPATIITSISAKSGGIVSSGGGAFISETGVCYNTSPDPTIANSKVPSGSEPGGFVSILSGLAGNTTYYVRAYATISTGTTYGNQIEFTTPATMSDADGNVYNTIKIGPQVWMAGNLRTTSYSNGTLIPNVTDDLGWAALNTGAYCNYDNDAANVATYGRLYNWYAATDPNNIAPPGWHVPTYDEWQILGNYLGGINEAGGHLKEAGLAHWMSPNTGADNSSGFTALPSGGRYYGAPNFSPSLFMDMGYYASWWTSTSSSSSGALFIAVDWFTTHMYRNSFPPLDLYNKRTGYSIRLVKD